jgi:hypothetical protein
MALPTGMVATVLSSRSDSFLRDHGPLRLGRGGGDPLVDRVERPLHRLQGLHQFIGGVLIGDGLDSDECGVGAVGEE